MPAVRRARSRSARPTRRSAWPARTAARCSTPRATSRCWRPSPSRSCSPPFPLGSKGRLGGVEWTVIGAMERSVTVEGVRYPWREYLLYEPRAGIPLAGGGEGPLVVRRAAGRGRRRRALRAAANTRARSSRTSSPGGHRRPRAGRVLLGGGARRPDGDRRLRRAAAHAVARRTAESEITWSLGTYTEPDEVWKAFALEGAPPEPRGRRPPPALAVRRAAEQVWTARAPRRGRARRPVPRRSPSAGGQDRPPQAVAIPPRPRPARRRRPSSPGRSSSTSRGQPPGEGAGAGEQLLALPRRRPHQRGDGRGGRVRPRGLVLLRHRTATARGARAAHRGDALHPRGAAGTLHRCAWSRSGRPGQRAAASYDAHGAQPRAALLPRCSWPRSRCWPGRSWRLWR